MLRASVANHKLGQSENASAQLHLRAALNFLEPYPDRHRGSMREFRSALTMELSAPRIKRRRGQAATNEMAD